MNAILNWILMSDSDSRKFICMKIQIKYIFKALFSEGTFGGLLPYRGNPGSPWNSLLYLFLPFCNFKEA